MNRSVQYKRIRSEIAFPKQFPASFYLEQVTKKIYGKPVSLPLLADSSLPKLLKNDINELYASFREEAAFFDKKVNRRNGVLELDVCSRNHLKAWWLGANLYCFYLDQVNRYKELMKKKIGAMPFGTQYLIL